MNRVLKIIAAVFVMAIATPLFADVATVVSAKGKVEVNRNGEWVALAENDKVSDGEIISTGFKSEAVLKYKGSVMQLGPLTRLTVEKLNTSDARDSVSVYLSTGNIKSEVNRVDNKRVSYTVKNPVAVASVRGTIFSMRGDGYVRCERGAVATFPARKAEKKANAPAAVAEKGNDEAEIAGTESAAVGIEADDSDDFDTNNDGLVITRGQDATYSSDGSVSTPEQNAANKVNAVANVTKTTADAQSISTGAQIPDSFVEKPVVAKKTGTISVTVTIEK